MSQNGAQRRRIPLRRTTIMLFGIVVLAVLAGWAMTVVRGTSGLPSRDFVSMPATALSSRGTATVLQNVGTIFESGLAVGVSGYLLTTSGKPVAAANVYVRYYYEFAYRTMVTATNQDGFFEILFPMNWTGWLPLTAVYFGDSQYQGVQQVFSLPGKNL